MRNMLTERLSKSIEQKPQEVTQPKAETEHTQTEHKRDSYNLGNLTEEVRNSIRKVAITADLLNDKELGRLFGKVFKGVLRYAPNDRVWYFYDGKVWKQDAEALNAKRLAKMFVDKLLEYCTELNLDKKSMAIVKGLQAMGKRNTIVNDAKCECPINTEDFDRDIYLLNCQNGTLDLRTIDFRPHNADDLLSKICNVTYDPNAKSELWERSIDEIMENDSEKIDYLQRVLGYCLTGDVGKEEFYILYGASSRNGKTTITKTISHLLGETKGYAATVAPGTISGKKERNASSPNSDIARLTGVRFAVVSELPPNMMVNSEMLKNLTGQDGITARHLYSEDIQFSAQLKLVINTNYLPKVSDDVIFESARVNVLELNHYFEKQEQDETLKATLQKPENLSGILNWLLDGLRKVWENGITPPQAVVEATARFREDCDKVGCFIADCLERTDGNSTLKEVYEAYTKWSAENGYDCEGKSKFKEILNNKKMIAKSATIEGKTMRNAIKGYTIVARYQKAAA